MVGVLGHRALGTARKSRRQCQRQVAALGLAQQAGGQAAAQRVQLDLGDRPLQAQEKASIRRARVVHAIAVADEALPVAAQVQQRIPVRAVPREPGHLVAQDKPDFTQGDAGNQVLEALAVRRRRPALAKVGVDDLDVGVAPAEVTGALAQRILQAQALLVGEHLMRRGLVNGDHRLAAQVPWRDEIQGHGLTPEKDGKVVEDDAAPVSGQAGPDVAGTDGHACSPSAARRSRSWIASRVSLVPATLRGSGCRLVAATRSRSVVPLRWAT